MALNSRPTVAIVAPAARPASNTRNFLGTYFTTLCLTGQALVSGTIIAVALHPAGRGVLAATLLWPCLLVDGGVLGLQWGVIRRIRQPGNVSPDRIASGTIQIALLVSLVNMTVLAAVLLLRQPRTGWAISGLALLVIPIGSLLLLLQAINQGTGEFGRFNRSRLLQASTYLGLVVLAWRWLHPPPIFFVGATLVGQAIACLSQGWKHLALIGRRGNLAEGFRTLWESRPFAALMGLEVLVANLGQVLTVTLLSRAETGRYAVGLALAGALLPLGSAVATVLFPQCTDEQTARQLSSAAFRKVALLGICIFFGFAATVPLFVRFVLGKAYLPSIAVALLLGAGISLKGPFDVLCVAMRGGGLVRPTIISRIAGIGVTGMAAFVLRAHMTLARVAFAGALGYVALCITLLVFAIPRLGLSTSDLNPFTLAEIKSLVSRVRALPASLRQ